MVSAEETLHYERQEELRGVPANLFHLSAARLLQVFITGMCIQPALRHLFRVNRTKISQLDSSHQRHLERESRHPPHVRIILAIVSILNILVTCCTFYQVTWVASCIPLTTRSILGLLTAFCFRWWGSLQIMTADDLWAFTIVDAFLPIPSALVGALVQTFFALRAWKVRLISAVQTEFVFGH